jgi:hypothetical protein
MLESDCLRAGGNLLTVCVALLVLAGCRHADAPDRANTPTGIGQRARTVTGTVRYIDVEGGFFGIVADDGTKLDPVNLPEDFRKDGVRIQVRVVATKDTVSLRMWGTPVRLIEIKRL